MAEGENQNYPGRMLMSDPQHYTADDWEMLEEKSLRGEKKNLKDQFITAGLVAAYVVFLAGLCWVMSIRAPSSHFY